jgi:oligopeptide/dipeptide ABC transporter ATP-binding protein
MSYTLLEVSNLKTHFHTAKGVVRAVDGVDFTLRKNETLAIVGESGSGKSVTALSILGLVPEPSGKIVEGEILYAGQDLLKIGDKRMRQIRGNDISMIFQEPITSLNPFFSIGRHVREVLQIHQGMNKTGANRRAAEMLRMVGIADPIKSLDSYPHQLSGGMCQRIMIAMALACSPKILIADEPTTALDVTIQSQILKLMGDLKQEINTSIILITHDLGVVAQLADNVMVMYAGKAVEYGDAKSIFGEPDHPYTIGLLNSIPLVDEERERLKIIRGSVPSPLSMPRGCGFCTRCDDVMPICREKEPSYISTADNRKVRCWKFEKQKAEP